MTTSFRAAVKSLQNAWHDFANHADAELTEYVTPALDYVKENGGKAVLMLAEAALTGAVAGTPWNTLTASLIAAAEASGIQLAEGAANAILNLVKAKLLSQGTPTA